MTATIDLRKIVGNQISGLEDDDLEFISQLIQNDMENPDNVFDPWTGFDLTNASDFNSFLSDLNSDNRDLSGNEIKEIEEIEENAKCKSTEKQTKHYIAMFLSFLKENKLPDDLKQIPLRYLESYLRLWFSRLKKKDGNVYSPTTLSCCRAAIHRHLLNVRYIPLIGNDQFVAFDRTFKAMVTKSLRTKEILVSEGGSGYPAIEPEDMTLLRSYFDRSNPQKLQDEVFFLILFHFGFRGREWLRNLTTKSLIVKESNGTKYVDFNKTQSEKNIRFTNQAVMRQAVMTSTPTTPESCPVEAVELYLQKLSKESPSLFPKPSLKYIGTGEWYCKKEVLGKNTLNDQMKKISVRAKLSRVYTNHSVRSTCVTNLRRQGFTPEQCQLVTGHNRVESIRRYDKRKATEKITFNEKSCMSRALSSSLNENSETGRQKCMQIQTINLEKSLHIQVPNNKRMKIKADGTNNIVEIVFE